MARNKTRSLFIFFILIILLIPVSLWLIWFLTPKKPMKILIMDKTVLTSNGPEHEMFNWILTNNRITKPDKSFYNKGEDYFGFFPLRDQQFYIKDLKKMNPKQIDSLANYYDMTYFTDLYGIYYNEWFRNKYLTEHSEWIYGGLTKNEYYFLKAMKEKKKLIIAEFNFIHNPTSKSVRAAVEGMFSFRWTGWTGRYFQLLDTLKNPELPRWVIRLYKEQHNNSWPFTKSGIVFIHEDETIAILEYGKHLNNPVPIVRMTPCAQFKYKIPESDYYPYWFDITFPIGKTNTTLGYYYIYTTPKGDSVLNHHGIPKRFPSAFEHTTDYQFHYFCGDYCDEKVTSQFQRLYGGDIISKFFVNRRDENNRAAFCWSMYTPMVKKIVNDYYNDMESKKK